MTEQFQSLTDLLQSFVNESTGIEIRFLEQTSVRGKILSVSEDLVKMDTGMSYQ